MMTGGVKFAADFYKYTGKWSVSRDAYSGKRTAYSATPIFFHSISSKSIDFQKKENLNFVGVTFL